MAAETGMNPRQTLSVIRRIDKLVEGAKDLICNESRTRSDSDELLRALQAFKEGKLGSVVLRAKAHDTTNLTACNLPVNEIPFTKKDKDWLRKHGIRFVGEIYYVHFDARSKYSIERGDRLMAVLNERFGFAPFMDPIELGWKPIYWQPMLRLKLIVLLLDSFPKDDEPDWKRVIGAGIGERYMRRFQHHPTRRTAPRRYHLDGLHYIGDLFVRAEVSQYCPNNKRSEVMLKKIKQQLEYAGSNLWAGLIVPPNRQGDAWQGGAWQERWEDEIAAIDRELETFSRINAKTLEETALREAQEEARRAEEAAEVHRALLESAQSLTILRTKINYDRLFDEYTFNIRTVNCMQNANIRTYGELIVLTRVELRRKTTNLGMRSVREIEEHLETLGLKLGMTNEEIKALTP